MCTAINGPVPYLCARRVLPKEVVSFPIIGGPNWPWNEAATAIRTGIPQNVFNTGCAKRALIATDARFKRAWSELLITVLAGWSEFKQEYLLGDVQLLIRLR